MRCNRVVGAGDTKMKTLEIDLRDFPEKRPKTWLVHKLIAAGAPIRLKRMITAEETIEGEVEFVGTVFRRMIPGTHRTQYGWNEGKEKA